MNYKDLIITVFLGLAVTVFWGCAGNNSAEQKSDNPARAESIPGEKIPFQRTGFPETCKAISKILKDTSNRKGRVTYFDGKSSASITFDSLGSILHGIYLFDQTNDDYNLFKASCNGLETFSWKQSSNKTASIRRQSFTAAKLLLTDYIINRTDFPKLIELRVIDSTRLTQLLIDDNVFTSDEGMNPGTLQRVYSVFDSIKAICKN